MTTRESRELLDLSREDQLRRIYALWTTKEAYTKALGIGLGFDFSRIDVQLDSASTVIAKVTVDEVMLEEWSFSLLTMEGGYLVAVGSHQEFDSSLVRDVSLHEMVAEYEKQTERD